MPKYEPMIGFYNWIEFRKNQKLEESEKSDEPEHTLDDDDVGDSTESEEEDYVEIRRQTVKIYEEELPPDFWTVKKLGLYIKPGCSSSPTVATLALLGLKLCNFNHATSVQALKENNQMSVILNFLTCGDARLQRAATLCLTELASIRSLRYELVYYGGLHDMVSLLWEPNVEQWIASAKAIAKIAVFHRARKIVRLSKGIPLLVNVLYCTYKYLKKQQAHRRSRKPLPRRKRNVFFEAAAAAARALNVLCEDSKNKQHLMNCGALTPCIFIANSNCFEELTTEVIGLLQTCSRKKYFRTAVIDEGFLKIVEKHLQSENRHLTQICAQAIFTFTEDVRARRFFGEGTMAKLCEVIRIKENHTDEELMSSVTGALWKCSKSSANVATLFKVGAIPLLISFLKLNFIKVHVHVVGCLGLCFRHKQSRELIKKNGIDILVSMLNTTHGPLVVNLTKAMAEASYDSECLDIIRSKGIVERVWSHLRNSDPWVGSNVAWDLCPILKNIQQSSAVVRELIGGMELIAKYLLSRYTRLSTPACEIVCILSDSEENLSLLADHGIVKLLSYKVDTKCKKLRYHLCEAISTCCSKKSNRKYFEKEEILNRIILMLNSDIIFIRRASCKVLSKLSINPSSCNFIYQSKGILKNLVALAEDTEVQEAALCIMQNIRLFSLVQGEVLTKLLSRNISRRREECQRLGRFK